MEITTNIWFGSSNTISPLHHDSRNNILTQIVGYKYIRIYSQKFSIYPLEGKLSNSRYKICFFIYFFMIL